MSWGDWCLWASAVAHPLQRTRPSRYFRLWIVPAWHHGRAGSGLGPTSLDRPPTELRTRHGVEAFRSENEIDSFLASPRASRIRVEPVARTVSHSQHREAVVGYRLSKPGPTTPAPVPHRSWAIAYTDYSWGGTEFRAPRVESRRGGVPPSPNPRPPISAEASRWSGGSRMTQMV